MSELEDILVANYPFNFAFAQKMTAEFLLQKEIEDFNSLKVLQEYEQKKHEAKKYTCPICDEQYTAKDLYILDQCECKVCWNCVFASITAKLEEGITDIHYPCEHDHVFSYSELTICLTSNPTIKERFEKLLLQNGLGKIKGLEHCPRPDCEGYIIVEQGSYCACPICNYEFCTKCKEKWHDAFSCEDYKKWKKDNDQSERKFQEYINRNTKSCPNCHTNIEKNGGCNHMTCSKCHHEFCWVCFRPWRLHGTDYYHCKFADR